MIGPIEFEFIEKDGRKLEGRTHIVEVEPILENNELIIL